MAGMEKSPLVAVLLGGEKSGSKPRAAKAPAAAAPTPEASPWKPPTVSQRMRESAKNAKVSATRDWVEGRISTAQHDKVHARANLVIKHGGRAKGKR